MKRRVEKNSGTMRTLNLVKTEMKNPEYTGSNKFNLNIEFPLDDEGKVVKVSVNSETTCTSSVASQEKMQELADKKKKMTAEDVQSLIEVIGGVLLQVFNPTASNGQEEEDTTDNENNDGEENQQ